MQALPQNGKMVAVFAEEATVSKAIQPYLDEVSLAAVNGPKSVVISGKREAVEEILGNLQAEEIKTKALTVSHAFHSPLMEPILEEFERVAREITYFSPQIDLISNVSGQLAKDEITTPEYWRRHIRQPVQFKKSMETLFQQGNKVFLEIGAQPILLGLGRQVSSSFQFPVSSFQPLWLPSLRQRRSDWQQLLQSLGELHVHGIHIDWAGFDRDYPRCQTTLPTYPFQRQRYWVEMNEKAIPQFRGSVRKGKSHPLLGQRLFSAALQHKEIQFESYITQDSPAFLKHHQVFQKVIPPTAVYVEMALAAGAAVFKSDNLVIEELVIQQALILPEDQTEILQITLTPDKNSSGDIEKRFFQIFSLIMNEKGEEPSWTLHASGKVFVEERDSSPPQVELDMKEALTRLDIIAQLAARADAIWD